MRTIAHISDLHFGTEIAPIVEGLLKDLYRFKPDLVAVSGDLTQRARRSQFAAAKRFLDRIPSRRLVVPGNHDVPLYDIWRRAFRPLARFRRYIADAANPFYLDEEIAVCGLNTARAFTWKEGRISLEQMAAVKSKLCSLPATVFKIVVTHHPFIPPPDAAMGVKPVGRASRAVDVFDECGVDLLLAGHLHHGFSGDVHPYFPKSKRSLIVIQAGTATSRRTRKTPNAYNLVRLKRDDIRNEVRTWNGRAFETSTLIEYRKLMDSWEVPAVSHQSRISY